MTNTTATATTYYAVVAFGANNATGKAYRSIETASRAAHACNASTVRIAGPFSTATEARQADISDNLPIVATI